MHRSLKPHHGAQAKKVPPPAIPGDPLPKQYQQQTQQIPLYRLGGSISSSGKQPLLDDNSIIMSSLVSSPSLEEGGFNLPRETTVALRMKDELNESITAPIMPTTTPAIGKTANNATANALPCPPPVFCATLREPLTLKAAVYYHQQLALQEDQGIDLTQSPGRDSPGSSSGSAGSGSRHSTASLDSGRASSYLTGVSGASIRGGVGGGALSSPRCSSVSSCSIGSVDRQRNDELIVDWLMEMKYEEYAQLFIAAGYDLPTIARMTPEDLTAIGIKNPHHRERIKQRIDKLQVLDNLPHFVPGSIEEWLQLLRLEEYIQPLLEQNYKTVRDVTQVTWEDLEDIGIVKLGHQKKILLAIKRVKDIISGKWNPGGINAYQQHEYRKTWQSNAPQLPLSPIYGLTPMATRISWDDARIYANHNGSNNHNNNNSNNNYNHNIDADAYYCTGSNHECCSGNDVVLIKVRQPRGKSLESLEDIHDNSTRSHLTFSHYTATDYGHFGQPTPQQQQQAAAALHAQHFQQQQQQQQQQQAAALIGCNRMLANPTAMSWRRSYDDGDITPTNDATRDLLYEEGGGTLPRQQRGILQRAVLNSMPAALEHHHYMNAAAAEYVCQAAGLMTPNAAAATNAPLDASVRAAAYLSGSPMTGKKIAPEPPRRHCSIRNSRNESAAVAATGATGTQQQHAQNIYYAAGGIPQPMHPLHATTNYLQQQQQQQQQQQPIYANYATIQQTTAEIHCEKFHDNKSNSSIDSIDTIPFANENTGTIKQRLLNRQDFAAQQQQATATHLHSSSSSSSSSSTNTIANIAHSFHSLKSSASLHDASLIRSDSIGSNTSGGSAAALLLRSPTLQYPPDANIITTSVEMHAPSSNAIAADAASINNSNSAQIATNAAPKVSVNVLNDIGNMLANLTDELDAMLEEEKRAGLNIDSE